MNVTRIRRPCWTGQGHGPHGWEPLNPTTGEPFRRGRVVFFCTGARFHR